MFTLSVSFDSLPLYIFAANILIVLTYILHLFQKKRNLEKSIKNIADFITEYFVNAGTKVQVTCFQLQGTKRFVTLIESEPLKLFRHSNLLESNLIAHILKITGNVVEKIYWRFPVSIINNAMTSEDEKNLVSDDLYFLDVHVLAKAQSAYKVSEASWDEFEISEK